MKMWKRRSLSLNGQWKIGGSVLGEGFDDDTAEEMKFDMAASFGE